MFVGGYEKRATRRPPRGHVSIHGRYINKGYGDYISSAARLSRSARSHNAPLNSSRSS